jgi:hypothetical protein
MCVLLKITIQVMILIAQAFLDFELTKVNMMVLEPGVKHQGYVCNDWMIFRWMTIEKCT